MMKKFLSAFVIIILFVSCSFAYSGGDGSSENPYVISTESDLIEFRDNVNDGTDSSSYFIISTDAAGFQMTKYNTWTPVGNANSFTGHLEGNGKIIYVNMNTDSSIAFFGTIGSGAAVSNLSIEGSVKSNTDAAGFALTLDGGTLTNCRFSGQIYVDDEIPDDPTQNLNAAGLVGYMNSGTIENCTFNGEIKIDGGIYPRAGGLVALMHGGTIKDCDVSHYSSVESYATEVEVTDDNDVVIPPSAIAGGIAGQVNIGLSETIEGCEFHGKVTAESWNTSYAGGIVGYMRGGTLKNNSVLDDSVISGKYTAGGIAGFLRTGGTVDNNTAEAGSAVKAESYSAGGIIGILDLGTVTNNESHASISGNASSKGGIIGKVTPATESPATRIISGNKYSGADYGIGSDASGSPSNEGSDETESPFYITTSATLPSKKIYDEYSQIFGTNISSDSASWVKVSGDFPSGLTLSGNTLSGTPTETGTFEFTLRASLISSYKSSEKTFSLTIESQLNIITSSDLESGTSGREYGPVTLETDAEDGAYITWTASGLPVGLSLGNLTGILSGTPTTAGYYEFTVRASSGAYTAAKTFTITINPSLTITTDSELPSALINSAYSVTLSSDVSDSENVIWSLVSSSLPSGLSLSTSGVISGTPTVSGTFNFTIQASVDGTDYTDSKDFNLTIRPEFYITTDSNLPSAKVFHDYSVTLEAASTAGSVFTWSLVSSDLPSGLTLNASTGTISGIPTTEGTYKFTIQVTADGRRAAKEFTLEVRPALYITTPSPLPTVKEGANYEVKLETDIESDMIVMWSVISGDLPDGLTLRENTGVISGIPDTEGTYVFVIHAKAGQLESNKTFILTVKPALSIITSSDLPDARPNESYSLKLETDAEEIDTVTWEFVSGDLPDGFAFNSQTGTISGNSSREGVYEFTIKAEVQTTARRLTAQKKFVLAVRREIIITNSDSYMLNAGSYCNINLDTFGSSAGSSYSWSVISGDIPEGLSLNPEGTLTGIPAKAGTFRFTLEVSHGYSQGRKDFTFTVKLAITSPSYLPNGTRGRNYSELLTVEGTDSAVWSVSSDALPPGLTLSSKGIISGIPTKEGIYNFNVNVSSDNGLSASKLLRITIDSDLAVPITTVSLPSGKSGESYYAELYSGVSGVTWSITDGRLPDGLTLNASNGLISGIPYESGTFTFTVRASYGQREGTRRLTLWIAPADVKKESEDTHISSSGGGGGCNTVLNLSMIFASLGFIFRRRF